MNLNDIIPYIHHSLYRQCYKGWYVQTRTIPDHELVLVLGGKGSFVIQDVEYSVKKGMLFYFYPGLIHSAKTQLDDPMRFLAVHFNFAFVDYGGDGWKITPGNTTLPLQPVQQLINYFIPANTLRQVNEIWNGKLPGYELLSRALFQKFLYEIFDCLKVQSVNYSSHLKVERVIEYLHQNLDKKVLLNDVAELVNLSVPYLSQLFKQYTGYTLMDYHNRLRIDKAKGYLFENKYKIKEISDLLGFKDEFYFSRLFKKLEGVSPSNYYLKKIHE